jgi:hypothetical protein
MGLYLTPRCRDAKKLFLTGLTGFKEQDLGYRGWDLGNNNRVLNRDGQDIQDKNSVSHKGHRERIKQ